jgi:hypothetical protein
MSADVAGQAQGHRVAPLGRLSAGVDKVEITPAELAGLSPWGGDFAAVHDPLFLRSLVIADGTSTCAIITLDLVEVGDTTRIRSRLENEVGVPAERIMIVPSHTHNSPALGIPPDGSMTVAPSSESLAYTEHVHEQMVASLGRALSATRPIRVGHGRGVLDINMNRDQYVDGEWVLGHNPDLPSDKTLQVVVLEDAEHDVLALLLNYAVHPTATLGTREISADLVGVALAHAETELGDPAVAFWLPGALGDQGPRMQLGGGPHADPPTDLERELAYSALRAQGLALGATAVAAAANMDWLPASAAVVGLQRVSPCPIRRQTGLLTGMSQADVDAVELTISCIAIGSLVFLGAGGEVTTPLMQELMKASPATATMLISNANARIGYLAEDGAFERMTFAARGSSIARGYAHKCVVEVGAEMIYSALVQTTKQRGTE